MVTASVQNSADGVQGALADRELTGIAALAVLGAGGVFLGQEVADQVLPLIGMPMNPSSMTDLTVSAMVKLVSAVVLAAVAVRLGTTGKAAAGTMAFGVLVSMGLDLVDAAQGAGASATSMISGSPSPSPQRQSNSPKRVSRPKKTAPKTSTAAGSGTGFR